MTQSEELKLIIRKAKTLDECWEITKKIGIEPPELSAEDLVLQAISSAKEEERQRLVDILGKYGTLVNDEGEYIMDPMCNVDQLIAQLTSEIRTNEEVVQETVKQPIYEDSLNVTDDDIPF